MGVPVVVHPAVSMACDAGSVSRPTGTSKDGSSWDGKIPPPKDGVREIASRPTTAAGSSGSRVVGLLALAVASAIKLGNMESNMLVELPSGFRCAWNNLPRLVRFPCEAPTSGCISCQGDGSDRATYWLLMWLKTCALATFLGRCAKLAWTVFVLMVWRHLEAKRNALPGPPAPVLGDDDEEGAPANVAEAEARVPPPPPQGTENVPNAADAAAGTGAEVKPSSIVAATVSGSALLLSLMPPPPLPARSISAPARLVSTPVDLAAEGTICGDVSPAALA